MVKVYKYCSPDCKLMNPNDTIDDYRITSNKISIISIIKSISLRFNYFIKIILCYYMIISRKCKIN